MCARHDRIVAGTQNANRYCGRYVQGYVLAETRGQMETVFTGRAGDPAARWVSSRFTRRGARGAAYRLAIGLGHVGCDRNPKVCRLTSRSYGRLIVCARFGRSPWQHETRAHRDRMQCRDTVPMKWVCMRWCGPQQ